MPCWMLKRQQQTVPVFMNLIFWWGEEGGIGMCDILDMCYEKGKHRVLWAAGLGRVPKVIWASGRLPEEVKAKLRSSPKSSLVGLGCIRRHNQ